MSLIFFFNVCWCGQLAVSEAPRSSVASLFERFVLQEFPLKNLVVFWQNFSAFDQNWQKLKISNENFSLTINPYEKIFVMKNSQYHLNLPKIKRMAKIDIFLRRVGGSLISESWVAYMQSSWWADFAVHFRWQPVIAGALEAAGWRACRFAHFEQLASCSAPFALNSSNLKKNNFCHLKKIVTLNLRNGAQQVRIWGVVLPLLLLLSLPFQLAAHELFLLLSLSNALQLHLLLQLFLFLLFHL